jgi:transcriptional regulator with XRE-family HTH domain
MADNKRYSTLQPLADEITSRLEAAGWSRLRFCEEFDISHSTLTQIVNCHQKTVGIPTLKKIAAGLTKLTGEKFTYVQLQNMTAEPTEHDINDRKSPDSQTILKAGSIVWHVQRQESEEQMDTFVKILPMLQARLKTIDIPPKEDFPIARYPLIETLITLIQSVTQRFELETIGEFVDWAAKEHPEKIKADRSALIEGLFEISVLKQIPFQDREAYDVVYLLAAVLGYKNDDALLDSCGLKAELSTDLD